MAKKGTQKKSVWPWALIFTIIGALAAVLALWPNRCDFFPCTNTITVRVTDPASFPIQGASVIFFANDSAFKQYTDSDGQAVISGLKNKKDLLLIVQAEGNKIYEQQFSGYVPSLAKAQMEPLEGDQGTIIFRLFDQETSLPVPNAQVMVIVGSINQSKVTDSNGVMKAVIEFPSSGMVEAVISVKTADYDFKNENITLYPDKVQDIVISKPRKTLDLDAVDAQSQEIMGKAVTKRTTANGVVVQSVISSKVDPNVGFKITQGAYTTNKNVGEIQVNWVSPTDESLNGVTTQVFLQQNDVNSQPMLGRHIGTLRANEGGMSRAEFAPELYGIKPEINGYAWNALMFHYDVKPGESYTVLVVPSQLLVTAYFADGGLLTDGQVVVYTQRKDANGKSIPDKQAGQQWINDTGASNFTLTPGRYAIKFSEVLGNDWGSTDIDLPPATQIKLELYLGRIQYEARDKGGKVVNRSGVQLSYAVKDANGDLVPGKSIKDYWTNNTGIANINVTPGSYFLSSQQGQYQVDVKPGKVVIVKNTDFKKP